MQELISGPLTMQFDCATAMLRTIRLGDREIVRCIYAAIRDRDWNTIPFKVHDLQLDKRESSFSVEFLAICSGEDIRFQWRGAILGFDNGTVRYEFRGTALSSFLKNRIGLCLLHPIVECAGMPCCVEHTDGTLSESSFPKFISPHQPFLNMRSITHQVTEDCWARVLMSGETFEMEDQRNWTDASFKTYSTPLAIPFPVEVTAGTQIDHQIEISLENRSRGGVVRDHQTSTLTVPKRNVQRVAIDWNAGRNRPPLGLQLGELTESQVEVVRRLKAMRPDHLRVDLQLSDPSWFEKLAEALRIASSIDTKLELALHATELNPVVFSQLCEAIAGNRRLIARWLLYHANANATTRELIEQAVPLIQGFDGSIPVVVGTDAYFAELNRNRPVISDGMLVCYSTNPQVHAFDNISLSETLEALRDTVDSAVDYLGTQVVISPVTLKPRFNPNATSTPFSKEQLLLEAIDNRQSTGFAAAWLVGVIAQLATHPSLHSLTVFEAAGDRGVMAADGSDYPTTAVMEFLLSCKRFFPANCTQVRTIAGLGCENIQGRHLMLANLTEADAEVDVEFALGRGERLTIAAHSVHILRVEELPHA